ncbi:hypothetical protein RvY_08221 [Ramazzottius varieornatus]|uniref:Uncharacterized protein n=1 Tax=Ramazzottius varieornatus TaxID=947166 RepID=A0A1D1VD98_RAMVA|nr:hypothetical protein RvY_08221 [Ramazzottius varieornatus]
MEHGSATSAGQDYPREAGKESKDPELVTGDQGPVKGATNPTAGKQADEESKVEAEAAGQNAS